MDINELGRTVSDAKHTLYMADQLVNTMLAICCDRLRLAGVNDVLLKRLKRELRDFNICTGRWKESS